MKDLYNNMKYLLSDYAERKSSRIMFAGVLVDMLHKTEKEFINGEISKIEKFNIFVNILQHIAIIMDNKRSIFSIRCNLNSYMSILQESPHILLNDLSFTDMPIPYIQLNRCILKNIDFTGAVIPRFILKNCNLINCKLDESVLRDSQWKDCSLINCSLNSAVLSSSTWYNCNLFTCTYHNTNLVSASFKISRLTGCAFDQQPDRASARQTSEESDMNNSLWTRCILETCTFHGSNLSEAKFKQTKFISTSFELANTNGVQGIA